jgi:hypothetical protein
VFVLVVCLFFRAFCLDPDEATRVPHPVGLAYQPSASGIFLSQQINHQQSVSSTFLSKQISTIGHRPNEEAAEFLIARREQLVVAVFVEKI